LRASGGALADWKQFTSLTSFTHAFSGSLLAGQGLRNRRRPLGAWINQNRAVQNVQAVPDVQTVNLGKLDGAHGGRLHSCWHRASFMAPKFTTSFNLNSGQAGDSFSLRLIRLWCNRDPDA